MGLRFSRDERNGIIRVDGDPGAALSLQAILDVDRAILDEIGDPAGLRVLYDMREVCTAGMTGEDFAELARLNETVWKDGAGGRAAVLSRSTLAFGQARQYQIVSEQHRARAFGAFTDLSAAMEWLLVSEHGASADPRAKA